MGSSIQDYAKKINSRLTIFDCVSLLVTAVFLLFFTFFLYKERQSNDIPVSYIVSNQIEQTSEEGLNSRPFASKTGETYTFSWCGGSSRITVKNRIYFVNEAEAIESGRRLSKLCTN